MLKKRCNPFSKSILQSQCKQDLSLDVTEMRVSYEIFSYLENFASAMSRQFFPLKVKFNSQNA